MLGENAHRIRRERIKVAYRTKSQAPREPPGTNTPLALTQLPAASDLSTTHPANTTQARRAASNTAVNRGTTSSAAKGRGVQMLPTSGSGGGGGGGTGSKSSSSVPSVPALAGRGGGAGVSAGGGAGSGVGSSASSAAYVTDLTDIMYSQATAVGGGVQSLKRYVWGQMQGVP